MSLVIVLDLANNEFRAGVSLWDFRGWALTTGGDFSLTEWKFTDL